MRWLKIQASIDLLAIYFFIVLQFFNPPLSRERVMLVVDNMTDLLLVVSSNHNECGFSLAKYDT